MNRIKFVSVIISALIFTSCTFEKSIEFGNIDKFNISGFNNRELVCSAIIEISNKSFFSFQLEADELIVMAGESKIGIVKLLQPVIIEGHSLKQYKIDFTVLIDNPQSGLLSAFGNIFGNKAAFKIKGSIIAKSFLLSRKIFIDKPLGIE